MDPQVQQIGQQELREGQVRNEEFEPRDLSQGSNNNCDSDSSFSLDENGKKSQKQPILFHDERDCLLRKRGKHGLKYAKISNETREALINQVTSTGCTIKSAALKLQINFSTAKAIMQIFKKEGRSCKKVIRKNRRRRPILSKRHFHSQKDTSLQVESQFQKEEHQKIEHQKELISNTNLRMPLLNFDENHRQQQAVIQQLTSENVLYQSQVHQLLQEKTLLTQRYQSLAQQYYYLEAMVQTKYYSQVQQMVIQMNYPNLTHNFVA